MSATMTIHMAASPVDPTVITLGGLLTTLLTGLGVYKGIKTILRSWENRIRADVARESEQRRASEEAHIRLDESKLTQERLVKDINSLQLGVSELREVAQGVKAMNEWAATHTQSDTLRFDHLDEVGAARDRVVDELQRAVGVITASQVKMQRDMSRLSRILERRKEELDVKAAAPVRRPRRAAAERSAP